MSWKNGTIPMEQPKGAAETREWKGRMRKTVGPYRIIFMKFPARSVVEISAVLIRSKDTYR